VQLITAIVKPHKVEDVTDALKAAGAIGMTITEVRGFGRQGGHTETYRGTEYEITFIPKVEVKVVAADEAVDTLVDAIVTAARTEHIGDGKVWVTPVDRLIRIRTGEEGTDAI
jgi:nitrogen regulatory protein PII